MKLYYAKGACSLSPHIALAESGLNYQLIAVNLGNTPHTTENGEDFTTINAKGSVPALQLDNDQILTESAVIVQYIADQVPDKKLAPTNGTMERYRLQEWLNFISSEVHKGFGPLWNPSAPAPEKDVAWQKLSKQIDRINNQLEGKEYLLGSFSVADCYVFTCLNWANILGRSLDQWPNIKAFMNRMATRPAIQQALKEEDLI